MSNNNRVLGRVLAVEETMNISGARPTSPSHDNITKYCLDSSPEGECVRTPATNQTTFGSNIITTPIHTSGI